MEKESTPSVLATRRLALPRTGGGHEDLTTRAQQSFEGVRNAKAEVMTLGLRKTNCF